MIPPHPGLALGALRCCIARARLEMLNRQFTRGNWRTSNGSHWLLVTPYSASGSAADADNRRVRKVNPLIISNCRFHHRKIEWIVCTRCEA
jgi:hypothetical protein